MVIIHSKIVTLDPKIVTHSPKIVTIKIIIYCESINYDGLKNIKIIKKINTKFKNAVGGVHFV